jgi:hypothetical protein
MPEQQATKLSDMAIGEKGFCSVKAYYHGPVLPVWEQPVQAGGKLTTGTFLLDSDVYPDRSPRATLYVERLSIVFAVGLPDGAPPAPYRADHPQIPLPVAGHNPIPPE